MTNKNEDQDWLDALAGKPNPDADPESTRRATALRQAIQRHDATLNQNKFDADAGLQKLKFKLRREGLSGVEQPPILKNHFVQFAMAASVVLTVGLMVRNYLPQDLPKNEAEIMRGGNMQIVLAADPEARLKQLTTVLDQLGIKYEVERKEGKLTNELGQVGIKNKGERKEDTITLKIHGVDPAKEDVASFLERNHITPPVGMDVLLDIRPLAKP
jgi:hypothetical protein